MAQTPPAAPAPAPPAVPASGSPVAPTPAMLAALEKQASDLFAERSFAQAAQTWQQLLMTEIPPAGSPRQRELLYRINDSNWRARSASAGSSSGELTPYLQVLRDLTALES
ncbi:MAG TPA: hypothetical protein VK970_21460, partial [Candidatus Methylacidiphilales bacterium]|nr:hypothetical protein [Candidatus Methylacidiphilales bacterium]